MDKTYFEEETVGISNDRLNHILGVARKAYKISKKLGKDESFARKMFMLGWCHDIGYEFSQYPQEHPKISVELIESAFGSLGDVEREAILRHGCYATEETLEWKILVQADLQVDSKGNEVNVGKRLYDIKERYGEMSDEYLTSCDNAYTSGLTNRNLAGHIFGV